MSDHRLFAVGCQIVCGCLLSDVGSQDVLLPDASSSVVVFIDGLSDVGCRIIDCWELHHRSSSPSMGCRIPDLSYRLHHRLSDSGSQIIDCWELHHRSSSSSMGCRMSDHRMSAARCFIVGCRMSASSRVVSLVNTADHERTYSNSLQRRPFRPA